ncbi:hypothetical protein PAXINDRAFT_179776 [Paxillus involutus ATCC 200175]|nr:hypothetical protein PAXINDRAFT_179776 [Paxillus involutus ATCC 200175]
MFGWSNSHLHQAEVFPNVVLHSDKKLPGTIKSCGRKRPLEDYELGDALAIDHWKRFEMADRPIYRVQPKVRQRKDEFDSIMTMEDKILTLESIWTPNEKNNVSDGECSNAEVGIVYVYDLGDEWTVHITCEQGKIFYRADVPSNLPVITDAAGAPPIEHASGDVFGEEDAEDKTVSPRLFDASYFQGYCEGTVTSCTRKTELEILTNAETEEKRREYLLRQKEKQERIANGEQEEEDEESDEEY